MSPRVRVRALLTGAALLACPAVAQATPVSATLTASNGNASYDETIGCPAGDGSSWQSIFSGGASGGLAGTFSGTVEVHQGLSGGFVPDNTGRLRISSADRGQLDLEFGGGDCSSNPLTFSSAPDGDPVAGGTLPLHATGGSGSYRGMTGTGTATISIDLGPGAASPVSIAVAGDFGALPPQVASGQPSGRYVGLFNFLNKKLSLTIPVANAGPAATVGDAFDVKVSAVTASGGASAAPVPQTVGRLNAGQSGAIGLTLSNAAPNTTYTITTTVTAKDALNASVPPVTKAATFKTPGLPS